MYVHIYILLMNVVKTPLKQELIAISDFNWLMFSKCCHN